jgi:hypothetical protein
VKLRRLREGDVLEDVDVVPVRGAELDQAVLRANALQYHSIYGGYGISVFAVRGATLDEMAQQVPLVRFESLTLLRGTVPAAGWLPRLATGGCEHGRLRPRVDIDKRVRGSAGPQKEA